MMVCGVDVLVTFFWASQSSMEGSILSKAWQHGGANADISLQTSDT